MGPALSADQAAAESWKLSLPCTKAEADAMANAAPPAWDDPPALIATEAARDEWRLDAYFGAEPGPDILAALRNMVPSAADAPLAVERIPPQDWVTLSQQGLDP